MDIGNVLTRAGQIVWKYKVLWIFGILASCTGAGGTNNRFEFQISGNDRLPFRWDRLPNVFENLSEGQTLLIVILVLGGLLLLWLLAMALGAIGHAGLIRGTELAEEEAPSLMTWGDLFGESLRYFWRVLGLNLLFGILILVLFGLFITFFFGVAIVTFGIGILCLLPLLCLALPLIWFLQVVLELANVALVVDDVDIFEAIRRAWQVAQANLGNIILMALVLTIAIGWIAGTIISLPMILVVAPIAGGILLDTQQAVRAGWVLACLCGAIYLPIFIVLSGILRSYVISAWTLTYMRLTGERVGQEPLPDTV